MFHSLRRRLTVALRSLRWRLIGWYVLLLSAVLLLFSIGTYVAVQRLLLDNFDELLASQANLIVQTIDFSGQGLGIQNASLYVGRYDNEEHLTRIYRADGTPIFDDNVREQASELAVAAANAIRGQKQVIQVRGRVAQIRVLSLPIMHDGQIVGALQVGLSLEDVGETMRALLKVMLLLAPVMLLLASGGGLFLANRALAPIDRITRTAQRISAEDLSQRLDLRGPDDEVGRLARTFDAMLTRLQAAFEQQRRFAADASHELRTPLTALIGQLDVAIERPRDAESYRATLLSVREQARRLARLSNELLFLARSDTQPAPATPELIDLGDLLPAIVAQLEPLALAKQQRVAFDPAGELLVCGNEDDLIRLFLNLLDNAIRYTPRGGLITVEATVAQPPPNGHQREPLGGDNTPSIIVRVVDSGPGIAPEHLPQLFERFFRVDRGRSRAQGGSGLGLAIAQSIVRSHGGQLVVTSTVGQGSTFTAVLPCAGDKLKG